MSTIFWLESLKGREDVGGRIILKWILGELGFGGVDWINLPQNRNRWWVLVNTVMNLQVQ
jgi:hypothetical protein